MDDLSRTQSLGCGALVVLVLGVSGLSTLASLAVHRWGVIVFVPILVAMVAAALGLEAMGWMRRQGEGTRAILGLFFVITTSDMAKALGVPFWGSWLVSIVVVLAVWFVISRGLPWWQSRQGDSRR